jgi:hypothetical protein
MGPLSHAPYPERYSRSIDVDNPTLEGALDDREPVAEMGQAS